MLGSSRRSRLECTPFLASSTRVDFSKQSNCLHTSRKQPGVPGNQNLRTRVAVFRYCHLSEGHNLTDSCFDCDCLDYRLSSVANSNCTANFQRRPERSLERHRGSRCLGRKQATFPSVPLRLRRDRGWLKLGTAVYHQS
jgi:hypothetical protein